MEKKSTRRKRNTQTYDPQHRRRGNQNARKLTPAPKPIRPKAPRIVLTMMDSILAEYELLSEDKKLSIKDLIELLHPKLPYSDETIRNNITRYNKRLKLNAQRIPLKNQHGKALTNEQYLLLEEKRIIEECVTHIIDIKERHYESKDIQQGDINNAKQWCIENLENLSPLRKIAEDNPSGAAYIISPPNPRRYLAHILISPAYKKCSK